MFFLKFIDRFFSPFYLIIMISTGFSLHAMESEAEKKSLELERHSPSYNALVKKIGRHRLLHEKSLFPWGGKHLFKNKKFNIEDTIRPHLYELMNPKIFKLFEVEKIEIQDVETQSQLYLKQ